MAIPAIMQQIMKSNPMLGKSKQMMGMVSMAQNPQAALNQLMMNNPQMKQVMDIVNQYGGDVNRAVEAKAAEYGMTVQDVMELIK